MPNCLNSKGTYKGTEPSPKGRGYCAKGENVGKKMKGLDKNMWIISETKNGQKRWIKYTKKKIDSKKSSKKVSSTKKSSQIKGPKNIVNKTLLKYHKKALSKKEQKPKYQPITKFITALYTKTNFDKHIGKVILVKLPNNVRARYRWITRKNDKGRYYARAPKIGVLIRDLDLKRDSDYNKETLLPVNATYN